MLRFLLPSLLILVLTTSGCASAHPKLPPLMTLSVSPHLIAFSATQPLVATVHLGNPEEGELICISADGPGFYSADCSPRYEQVMEFSIHLSGDDGTYTVDVTLLREGKVIKEIRQQIEVGVRTVEEDNSPPLDFNLTN